MRNVSDIALPDDRSGIPRLISEPKDMRPRVSKIMKFRQLNFNPFLRVRSKSKKKNNKKADYNPQISSKDDAGKSHVNLDANNQVQEFVQVKESDIVDLDLDYRPPRSFHQNFDNDRLDLSVDIKSQYRLELDDYYYPVSNDGTEIKSCLCFNKSVFVGECNQFVVDGDENQYCSGSSLPDRNDIDPYSNTIPKARSRIKTNPWLPSPKLSPLSLTCSAPSEALSLSDVDSETNSDEKRLVDDIYCERSHNYDNSRDKINGKEAEKRKDISDNDPKPEVTKNKECDQLKLQDLNCRWSIISEGDVSIDLNSPTIEDLRERFSNLEHKVSFEYEDNVDSVLESDVTAPRSVTCLSINDLLDDSVNSDDSTSIQSTMTSSEDISSGAEMSSSRESSVMTESEIGLMTESENGDHDNFEEELSPVEEESFANENAFHGKICNMDDSIDAGYSSLSRDSRISSDSDSDSYTTERKLRKNHSSGDIATFFEKDQHVEPVRETTESYEKFADDLRKYNVPTSRTFSEVRLSLEEKVNQLRLEKIIVEQKIREAQEAEKIRLQEKLRFKQHMSAQRKEVLLQTLNTLKDRLESQSNRLEHNYNEVLNMQEKYSRRRHPFLFVSPAHVSS